MGRSNQQSPTPTFASSTWCVLSCEEMNLAVPAPSQDGGRVKRMPTTADAYLGGVGVEGEDGGGGLPVPDAEFAAAVLEGAGADVVAVGREGDLAGGAADLVAREGLFVKMDLEAAGGLED